MTYNKARVGIHAAVSSDRNRRNLAAIKRKYARYDRDHRLPWWAGLWLAVWAGWTVAREAVRNG